MLNPAFQELRLNERRVLQTLRRMSNGSKADIARNTGLTNTAIGTIVRDLSEKGLITTGKRLHEGQRGQPATLLHLNPTGAYGIGIRLERNLIQTILIDFDGNMLAEHSHEMLLPAPDTALEIVLGNINSILADMDSDALSRLTGIGLAQPFNLGSWLDELELPHNHFQLWDNYDFAGHLEQKLNIPVIVENDASSAAVAELFYGVGREEDDFLYFYFGPAVGGGLVIQGDVIRGRTGNAADLGLMPVPPSKLPGATRPKGQWDILLNRASLNSLRRHLKFRTGDDTNLSRSQLEEKIAENGSAVQEWLEDCVDALLPAMLASAATLDVPLMVLGANVEGGFSEQIRTRLQQKLIDNMPEARQAPRLVNSTFASHAATIGAAGLPLFYSFSPRKPIMAEAG